MSSAFALPASLLGGDVGLVAGLGRGDQVGRDQDVLRSSLSARCRRRVP